MNPTQRLIIYRKDIELITGKSERSARHLMARIRKFYNKPIYSPISVAEFCSYLSIPKDDVLQYLR